MQPSKVLYANGTRGLNEFRKSRSGFINQSDPVVTCVAQRAAEFQGFLDVKKIEGLQVTAYQKGGEYRPHFDWFPEHIVEQQAGYNRLSTFFATLDADCEDCGTQFPRLTMNWTNKNRRWCEFVECGFSSLTVKPIKGSAVFWKNLDADGYGNPRTLHAGLPLIRGHKVGLNIWTNDRVRWSDGNA